MKIKFRKHAKVKFGFLRQNGYKITENEVRKALLNPDRIVSTRLSFRFIAEKDTDATHKLRIVYEEHLKYIEIVTFYPAKRSKYEI